MVIREKRYTLADLREIDSRPENADKRFELLNGEIFEVPTPSPAHSYTGTMFVRRIGRYLDDNDIGYVFGDAVSYTLPNGDELIPDASSVSKARQPLPLPKRFLIAPDLAIEVASPSNTERELLEKAESYLESGSKLVWIVYLKILAVDVCRRNADGSLTIRKVDFNGVLDGEDVLPGFMLPVRDIFPPPEPE